MKKKYQPAKKAANKRTYNKRAAKWTKEDHRRAINNIELLSPPEPINDKKDNELAELTMICAMFDNMPPEQKQRVLKFLCGRYYDFM